MKSKLTFLFTILFFTITSHAQIRYLTGVLQASQEGPGVISSASGVVIVKYNTATNFLQLFGNYRNLTAAISVSHIHGPAGPGASAPPIITLNNSGGTTGTLSITATLTDPQEIDLLAGNMYTNVHTATYAGGEIRAQLTTTTDGQTEQFVARLQGAQQVPPNSSPATGMVYALV
ncbi:MAG: CHRD domain-containing protein, partial [Ginsengibacter sp.]